MMEEQTLPGRKPWIAAALSVLCCGLGQIYCGRVRRGLILYSLTMILGPLVVLVALLGSSTALLVGFLAAVAGLLAVFIWSISDARRIARSLQHVPFVRQDYHHPAVYTLLSLTAVPYALGLAFFLRANVIEAFYLPTSSMSPSLVEGDCIVASKLGIENRDFARGDVVVFRYPEERRKRFIKRIVALPGETVEIRDGEVRINGTPLPRTPLNDGVTPPAGSAVFEEQNGDRKYRIALPESGKLPDVELQTVPSGSYFLLGDNRANSHDSRDFRSVAHGEIVGLASYIYRPADRWDRFGPIP